jgi:hypothetical protein
LRTQYGARKPHFAQWAEAAFQTSITPSARGGGSIAAAKTKCNRIKTEQDGGTSASTPRHRVVARNFLAFSKLQS